MRWTWVWALCVSQLAAAPVVIFDDLPATAVYHGSLLRLGGGAAAGYRQLDALTAARLAVLGPQDTLPLVAERPLGGQGVQVRLSVLGDGVGWWEANLPIPAYQVARGDLADGRLSLALRGASGGELVDIGLLDRAVPRHNVRLPLSRYGRLEAGWTLFRVPLDDFLALAPDLDLTRLAMVQLASVRAVPLSLDVDQVRIEPGPHDPYATRTILEAPPAPTVAERPPTTLPTAPAGPQPPTTAPATSAVATAPRSAAGDGASAAPVTAVEPPASAATSPVAATASPPTVQATVAPTQPAQPPTQPAQSTPPVAGPRPATPGGGATVRLPDDARPMLPVSFFYTDAPAGTVGWEHSAFQATWATNQGERAFDDAELRESFVLAPGGRLPVGPAAAGDRSGAVLRLAIKEAGFAWWVARLGRPQWELSDERPYLRNGRLEFAVRGSVGGEVFRIGLFDDADKPNVALAMVNQYGEVGNAWNTIRIPLRALKTAGPQLDWARVKGVQLASAHGRPISIEIDDLRIVNPVGPEE
ncbi:MAG: hypothetical protein IT204_14495 [Fimbriimonadaceae bacterium]|nr:hypothetical protein [Fimbriimonadaceae bacterium]